MMIGAPAGQPEFAEWATTAPRSPFLRYLPERLSHLGARVGTALRERLAAAPSFEGYDTVAVLADVLRSHGYHWARPTPMTDFTERSGATGEGPR